jgi:hypothetical protein
MDDEMGEDGGQVEEEYRAVEERRDVATGNGWHVEQKWEQFEILFTFLQGSDRRKIIGKVQQRLQQGSDHLNGFWSVSRESGNELMQEGGDRFACGRVRRMEEQLGE